MNQIDKSTNNICKLKIFDLDEQKLYIRKCCLRIIGSLDGMTQFSSRNSLYLCGTNEREENNSIGSYLIRLDVSEKYVSSTVLVNTIYLHYKPMMLIIGSDIIVVVGGKEQISCEKYSIQMRKWREIPPLPEERYLGNLLFNEKDYQLYIFGGLSGEKFNDSILKYNLRSVGGWSRIILKENSNLLKRYNCISFYFSGNDNNIIYVCGGIVEEKEDNDFILEFDLNENALSKKITSLTISPIFETQSVVDVNKNVFVFADSKDNVFIIEKKNFKISIISSEDITQE